MMRLDPSESGGCRLEERNQKKTLKGEGITLNKIDLKPPGNENKLKEAGSIYSAKSSFVKSSSTPRQLRTATSKNQFQHTAYLLHYFQPCSDSPVSLLCSTSTQPAIMLYWNVWINIYEMHRGFCDEPSDFRKGGLLRHFPFCHLTNTVFKVFTSHYLLFP